MYKLIACDMDETLLNEDKQISEKNKQAIQNALKQGIKFVLASGRGFTAMQSALQDLGLYDLDNEYVISFNGGVITENKGNQLLEVNGISFQQAQQLFEFGLPYDVGFHIYTLDNVYMYRMNSEEKQYVTGRLDRYIEFTETNIEFLKQQPIIKVLFNNLDMNYLKKIEQNLPAAMAEQYTVSYSANRYIEFNQKGVSKGEALSKLANKLHIKAEEIIAIGDNSNDIAMLEFAGLGVSVQNGIEEVKCMADYICLANHNESAIAEVIDKFVLSK